MGRYGRSFSPYLRRLRESNGLGGPNLRFHSLRHSYADLLRAKKVPDDASAQLMGHVGNRVRMGYGTGYDLKTLHSWVNVLEPL
jgi:integrase